MKLLINTASTFQGGGVQVAASFIQECKSFKENEYHIILGERISKIIETEHYPENFTFYKINFRPAQRVLSFKNHAAFHQAVEEKVRPDCVFTTSGPAYWRPRAKHLMGYNLPHYIYQDSPFFSMISLQKKLKWKLKGRLIEYFIKHDADAFVTQTSDVTERLKKWIGSEKIYTVSNTYGSQYDAIPQHKNILPQKNGEEFRFLILSGYYAHKNLEILNPIIQKLRKKGYTNVKFILTLPEIDFKKCILEEHKNQVLNVGPQLPENCPILYEETDAVFMPSLLECFSATYAEAMKMKKPIITTDLGFAHTVCGQAALYFSPADPGDAVEKIIRFFDDINLRKELVSAGFVEMKKFNSAKERAAQYLELCKNLIAEA